LSSTIAQEGTGERAGYIQTVNGTHAIPPRACVRVTQGRAEPMRGRR
jgi:hypothetical protein